MATKKNKTQRSAPNGLPEPRGAEKKKGDPSASGGTRTESKRAKPEAMTRRNQSKKNDSGEITNPQSRSTPKQSKQRQPR